MEAKNEAHDPKECEYYTTECFFTESGGCLGTKEIDPCEGENCKRWKRREEKQ